MTQEELSLLDEREREAWELCQKATPGPWQEGWKNEHGAGCTGPRTAALCFASNDHLPIVIQPNAHKQSDNPEHWYGAAVARTAEKSDALFIAAARNLLEPLLSKVVRLTRTMQELGFKKVWICSGCSAAEEIEQDHCHTCGCTEWIAAYENEWKDRALAAEEQVLLAAYAAEERRAERERCLAIVRRHVKAGKVERVDWLCEQIAGKIEQGRG